MISLFSQVDVSLNGTFVTPSTNTYPYRAYIKTLLSHGAEAKNSQLTSVLWYKHTAGHMDATRGHKAALVKPYFRLDKRKFSFSQRTITDWNNLSHDCVNASSVNMFKNKIDNYLARAGYT